nr:hypothetical protein [Tanacetum cinerariifolium]
MPPEDDVLLAEEQPLSAAVSPTSDSPGYILESNPEEDLEEDPEEDDEDPEEDPADYPTNKDDDDDEEESSNDDANDEEDEDKDDEEDEEHLTPANSVPPPVHRVMARMSVRAQTPISLPSETEVAKLLAIPTLPPSPLSLLIQSLMIMLRAESPSTFHPPPPIVLPHTRASMAMLRDAAPSTSILAPRSKTPPSGTPPLLPIPLPVSSPPLLLPYTGHRADVPKVTLPPQKRLCIALGTRFEVGESSSALTARPIGGFRANYGFVGTLDDEIRQDTDEFYRRLDDAQDDKSLMSNQLNLLRRDRRAHARIPRLIESDAICNNLSFTTRVTTTKLAS